MSLELALAANTAAIQEQTAALRALGEAWNALREQATQLRSAGHSAATVVSAGVPQADAPKVEQPAPAKAPKAEKAPKPAPTPAVEEPAQPEAAADEPAVESPSEEAAPAPTLQDIQDLIRSNMGHHREAIVKTLAKYGAKRASELKAEDYAAFVATLTEKVAA